MADEAEIERASEIAHAKTYDAMIGLLKWGAVACFLLAFFVIWLIA